MIYARQSTAIICTVGPVMDATGVAVTDGVVGDFKISKNGGAPAALNGSATLTHRNTGHYSLSLTATDVNTVGTVEVVIDDTVNACPMKEITVIEPTTYDALFADAAPGPATPTNITAGTITTATNVTTVNGLAAGVITAAAVATGAIDADALAADAGTEIGTAVWATATRVLSANTNLNDPTAAAIADAVWDEDATAHQTQGTFGQAIGDPVADANTIYGAVVTGAAGATVAADIIAIKAETAAILDDTDDIGVAGAGLTAINLPDQTMNITGDITGNLSGSVGSVTGAVGSVTALAANSVTAAALAADAGTEIAAAVWDRVLTGATHNIASSAGRRLRQIDSAFEVHDGTAQAGSTSTTFVMDTGASTVNDIYNGDRIVIVDGTGAQEHGLIIDYDGASRTATMSKAWVVTPDATSVFEVLPADTDIETWNSVPVTGDGDWAELQTDVDAIVTATTAASIRTAVGLASANLDTQLDALPTNAELATALGTADDATLAAIAAEAVKTAAIKAKTDSLAFTVAGQVDSNIQYVNDVQVNGDGAGTPWGP